MTAEELLRDIEQGVIVTINGKVICTGAMWYDGFENHLYKLRGAQVEPKPVDDIALEAAKRAAGLSQESKPEVSSKD